MENVSMFPIPTRFFRPSLRGSADLIVRSLVLWIGPMVLMSLVVGRGLPLGLVVVILIPLAILSAHGLQRLGLVGHDGTHFNLHPNKLTSAYIGATVSSLVPLHLDAGFAVSHADHHRFANTARDPDLALFSQFPSLAGRLFLARSAASRRYLRLTLRLAFNRWPSDAPLRVGLPLAQLRPLAQYNLALSVSFLTLYVALAIAHPLALGLPLALSILATVLVSGLRPYFEHAGTDDERPTVARTWISPLFDFLYGGINYHLAHHLYPSVPSYRIKEFHAWMVRAGRILPEASVRADSIAELARAARLPLKSPRV